MLIPDIGHSAFSADVHFHITSHTCKACVKTEDLDLLVSYIYKIRVLERKGEKERIDTEMGLILTRLSGTNPSRQVIRGGGSTSTSGNHQDPQNLRSPDSCPPPKIHFPHPSFSPSLLLSFSPTPVVRTGHHHYCFFSPTYCIKAKTKQTASKTHAPLHFCLFGLLLP